ncbi:MAG: hypothetical protein ACK4FB_11330 [Brevundimonas sp.]|uniref:hypothetical protein n=1 Tax=Brevundimonas sp. TaxID=1871086 RepID=UPI003918A973
MEIGNDPKVISAYLDGLSGNEQAQARAQFWAWVREGAKVGGSWKTLGSSAIIAGLFVAFLTAFPDRGLAPWGYVGAVILAVAGAWVFAKGGRREKEWRAANPFKVVL